MLEIEQLKTVDQLTDVQNSPTKLKLELRPKSQLLPDQETGQIESSQQVENPFHKFASVPTQPKTANGELATIKNYKLIKTLGKGHFSKVKLAMDLRDKQFYAIKIIKRHHVESIDLLAPFRKILLNEVTLLQQMDHKHIIKLVEFNIDGEVVIKDTGKCIQIYFIVLELVELGDLFSFIKTNNQIGCFSEPFARHYFRQLLTTLEYLHNTAGVVHRDLKPENLLLNSNYELKLADFGLSSSRDGPNGDGIHYSAVGTRQYQAPEVLEKRSYNGESVDVFSVGVILFVMVTGALPYLGQASYKDPIYSHLWEKNPDAFWRSWLRYRDPDTVEGLKQSGKHISLPTMHLSFPLSLHPMEVNDSDFEEKSFSKELLHATLEVLSNCVWFVISPLAALIRLLVEFFKPKRPNQVIQAVQVKHSTSLKGKDCRRNVSDNKKSSFWSWQPNFSIPGCYNEDFLKEYSPEFRDLVVQMIAYNPQDRITFNEIKNHPFVTSQELPTSQEVFQQMSGLKMGYITQSLKDQLETLMPLEERKDVRIAKRPIHYLRFIGRQEGCKKCCFGLSQISCQFLAAILYYLTAFEFLKRQNRPQDNVIAQTTDYLKKQSEIDRQNSSKFKLR